MIKFKKKIKYRKSKYTNDEDYYIRIPIVPKKRIVSQWINLTPDKSRKFSVLFIRMGFPYDGPSGPVRDGLKKMRGAKVHDSLYMLMRLKWLDRFVWRKMADEIFRDILIEDGVSKIKAWLFYKALRRWGGNAASPKNKQKIYTAP